MMSLHTIVFRRQLRKAIRRRKKNNGRIDSLMASGSVSKTRKNSQKKNPTLEVSANSSALLALKAVARERRGGKQAKDKRPRAKQNTAQNSHYQQ